MSGYLTRKKRELAGIVFVLLPILAAAQSAQSQQKLEQLMQQRLLPAQSSTASTSTSALMPERIAQRKTYLENGEAALAAGKAEQGQMAFERAALISHAADTEMGLVRSYMQAGEYRRALAFGAHTAGAHLDVAGGSALYAWLLYAGGQRVFAQRLLNEAQSRHPGHPVVEATRLQLQPELPAQQATDLPLATGLLLQTPVRMAPGGSMAGLIINAKTVGTALLFGQGKHALVPTSAVTNMRSLWVRNGLGQLSTAHAERQLPSVGLTLLRLGSALPQPDTLSLTRRDAFAGSLAITLEYAISADASPRWPVLISGFLGAPVEQVKPIHVANQLGISLPAGQRGGPVLDKAGRLAGIAVHTVSGKDQMVQWSAVRTALGTALGQQVSLLGQEYAADANSGQAMPFDQIYENGLRHTLQVIGVERVKR